MSALGVFDGLIRIAASLSRSTCRECIDGHAYHFRYCGGGFKVAQAGQACDRSGGVNGTTPAVAEVSIQYHLTLAQHHAHAAGASGTTPRLAKASEASDATCIS